MSDHTGGAHWHAEPWPFMVGFGAGLFLPWAFMFQFVYNQGLFAIVALALAVILLVWGALGWVGETVGVITDEGWAPSAMLMFIGTEIMTVLGILVAYWTARIQAPVWPPEGSPEIAAPVISTLILVVSSFTAAFARKAEMNGNASGFANMVLVSMVIWVAFGAMTIMGWSDMAAAGLAISDSAYSTAVYGTTGVHFAHIVFGVLIMLFAWLPALKGKVSPSYSRAITMYVHFVNVLGIWILMQVFLW